jgi:hypothetical protein
MEVLSDAIALDLLLLLVKDWERKSRPAPGSVAYKQFQRNVVTLLDRLIYEYVNGQWRGSSDSKIAVNLAALESEPDVLGAIPAESWARMISGVVEEGQVNGQNLATDKIDGRVKVLLQYYYVLKGIKGPDEIGVGLDWDHIIPQAAFAESGSAQLARHMNQISNIALLPASENRRKGDRRLNEISDAWLVSQIQGYEEIDRAQFDHFSSAQHAPELMTARGALLKHAFSEDRGYVMINLQPRLAG